MSYLFFLSHARGADSGHLAERFFDDLVEEIAVRSQYPRETIGFRDATSIQIGDLWPETLQRALRTSRVFVFLESPRYFERQTCGKEWAVFQARIDSYMHDNPHPLTRPPLMLPVIWTPGATHITQVSNIQYDHQTLGSFYAEEGLRLLMKISRYHDDYHTFVAAFAKRIINVVHTFPLPDSSSIPPFQDVPNAFTQSLEPSAGKTAILNTTRTAGPRYVQFVYAVANRVELTAHRTTLTAYGEEPVLDWRPYFPPTDDPVTLLAQRVAVAEKLNYEMLPLDGSFIDNLRKAESSNKMVIIIVDLWSLHLERYRQLMCSYDENRFRNCVVIVPWNQQDDDTRIKATELTAILRATFSRQPETILRWVIKSSDQFMEAISTALNEGRRNILDLLEVFRKAEGDGPTLKPTINGIRFP